MTKGNIIVGAILGAIIGAGFSFIILLGGSILSSILSEYLFACSLQQLGCIIVVSQCASVIFLLLPIIGGFIGGVVSKKFSK